MLKAKIGKERWRVVRGKEDREMAVYGSEQCEA